MATLTTFNPDNYAPTQAGFLEALEDGATYDIDIDGFESYTCMYNVQNAVYATAKMTGIPVCLGAYDSDNNFATMDEMDEVAHDESWETLEQAVKMVLEKRKAKQLEYVQAGLDLFKQHEALTFSETLTTKQLAELGEALVNGVTCFAERIAKYSAENGTWMLLDEAKEKFDEDLGIDAMTGMPKSPTAKWA